MDKTQEEYPIICDNCLKPIQGKVTNVGDSFEVILICSKCLGF